MVSACFLLAWTTCVDSHGYRCHGKLSVQGTTYVETTYVTYVDSHGYRYR